MTNKEKEADVTKGMENIDELNYQEALDLAHELVREFLNAKQRMLADDRKLNALGSALIAQKNTLKEVVNSQSVSHETLDTSLTDISKDQETLGNDIRAISLGVENLQQSKDKQNEFIDRLKDFQEQHDKLVKSSQKQADESIAQLKDLARFVDILSEQLHELDIEGRVNEINKATKNIENTLLSHAEEQGKTREQNEQDMKNLLREVSRFRKDISDKGLVTKLHNVQAVSEQSDEKISTLNDKFDKFVSMYELSLESEERDLESIFEHKTDEEIEKGLQGEEMVTEDGPNEPNDLDELNESNESNGPINTNKDGSEADDQSADESDAVKSIEEDEDIVVDKEDDFSAPEISRKEKNKKGLFGKLFGGW